MKTKNAVIILLCIILAAFALGAADAVSLVNPSVIDDAAAGSDRLVGVLITGEYLDLFDTDAYLDENIDKLLSGEEIGEAEAAKYQGRLYATLVARDDIADESGATIEHKEYVFEGIEGIGYYTYNVINGSSQYWTARGDEAISDGSTHITSTDNGESISLEGTVYCSTRGERNMFYVNPVYQAANGEVYALGGGGISSDATPGVSFSKELKESSSSDFGDGTESYEAVVRINFSFMDEPTGISVIQFDKNSELISRTEYEPGRLPGMLDALPETEYVIVETTLLSPDGGEYSTRELYQADDERFHAFYARGDGICVKQGCGINWGT